MDLQMSCIHAYPASGKEVMTMDDDDVHVFGMSVGNTSVPKERMGEK